jgi:hypothetical protein
MRYFYKSRVGVFEISPQVSVPGRYALLLKGEFLGSYHSPQAAADDVYTQHTGDHDWDSLSSVTEPSDLTEWEHA